MARSALPTLAEFAATQPPKHPCTICALPPDVLAQARDAMARKLSSKVIARWLNEHHGLQVSDQTVRREYENHGK